MAGDGIEERPESLESGTSSGPKEEEDGLARLRISSIIDDLKERAGSYAALEREIRDFIDRAAFDSPGQPGAPCAIDRRKLKRIVLNDPKLNLSIGELRGIDQYLESIGQSLAVKPLFEKPELFRTIANSQHAVFLLGSKRELSDELRINISHWDVLGLSSIQSGLQGYEKNLRLDIREVRLRESIAETWSDFGNPEIQNLYHKWPRSLLLVGSSLGNPFFEPTLSLMAGFEPWTASHGKDRFDLPFHFVWPQGRRYLLPSRFHLHGEDALAEGDAAGKVVIEQRAAGFRYAGRYLIDELTIGDTREGYTYALCAAQRRAQGQVWLVVAGLTGPATYAAARWVGNMRTRFDEDSRSGRPSRVAWKLLRARARREDGEDGSTYSVGPAELVTSGYGLGPKG